MEGGRREMGGGERDGEMEGERREMRGGRRSGESRQGGERDGRREERDEGGGEKGGEAMITELMRHPSPVVAEDTRLEVASHLARPTASLAARAAAAGSAINYPAASIRPLFPDAWRVAMAMCRGEERNVLGDAGFYNPTPYET